MLRPLSSLQRFAIHAVDGDIGSVADCYFDDRQWVVRYLVVDTQRWLPGSRKVLISPYSVSSIDWQNERVNVSISREQVKSSPSIDLEKPVSRQHEADFLDYYDSPYYWGGGMLWGVSASPAIARPSAEPQRERELRQRRETEDADPHLRSADYVSNYHIQARDGAIGHVDDFIFDEQSWEVRFFVIDTRNWLPGRHVVLATEWIEEVNWDESLVRVPLTRDAIRASPEWDDDEALSESAEQSLYAHYGRTRDAGLRGERHS